MKKKHRKKNQGDRELQGKPAKDRGRVVTKGVTVAIMGYSLTRIPIPRITGRHLEDLSLVPFKLLSLDCRDHTCTPLAPLTSMSLVGNRVPRAVVAPPVNCCQAGPKLPSISRGARGSAYNVPSAPCPV